MDGQMLRRAGPAAAGPDTGSSVMTSPRRPMSSTGTMTSTSSCLEIPVSTMVTGLGLVALGLAVSFELVS